VRDRRDSACSYLTGRRDHKNGLDARNLIVVGEPIFYYGQPNVSYGQITLYPLFLSGPQDSVKYTPNVFEAAPVLRNKANV